MGSIDVTITSDIATVVSEQLTGGFFEDWPDPPDPATHVALLRGSLAVALAIDDAGGQVVGFATAVGDGMLAAYIPLLEVLPSHRGRGIGIALMEHLIDVASPIYMLDLACDDDVVPFYERLGFQRSNAMIKRDYAVQSGAGRT